MENVTIAEYFNLPSRGLIYKDKEVKERFKLKSMTTNDEMLRLAPSKHKYENLCAIIDNCMEESPGISAYDMCLGDYQYCLYMLRIVTYGPEYKIAPICPHCGSKNESVFDLGLLQTKEFDEKELLKYQQFVLSSGDEVVLTPVTPRLLDMIQDKVDLYKKKLNTKMDNTLLCYMISSVYSVNGEVMNEVNAEQWVRKMSMRDTNTILNYIDKLNGIVGLDSDLVFECDTCGLSFDAALSITSEFFRPTLDL